MKAISLWQPWATLIATGAKKIETRSWYTGYRGPLAIHASKRRVLKEIKELAEWEEYRAALAVPSLETEDWEDAEEKLAVEKMLALPYGAIVAVAQLVDCNPVERILSKNLDIDRGGWCERDLGNYTFLRFGWMLEDIKPLAEPIPFKGAQGFFDVPDELIKAQLIRSEL